MAKKMTKQDARKDAVYARQSLGKKDSLSIETQIDKGLAYADDNAEIYKDKGYSGKNTDRPDLQRLKADMEANKIKRVIVYRLDRISRNIADFYQLYQLMELHKIEFVSISENFDTSTPMGRAMMGILIVFAQMERKAYRNVSKTIITTASKKMDGGLADLHPKDLTMQGQRTINQRSNQMMILIW